MQLNRKLEYLKVKKKVKITKMINGMLDYGCESGVSMPVGSLGKVSGKSCGIFKWMADILEHFSRFVK